MLRPAADPHLAHVSDSQRAAFTLSVVVHFDFVVEGGNLALLHLILMFMSCRVYVNEKKNYITSVFTVECE